MKNWQIVLFGILAMSVGALASAALLSTRFVGEAGAASRPQGVNPVGSEAAPGPHIDTQVAAFNSALPIAVPIEPPTGGPTDFLDAEANVLSLVVNDKDARKVRTVLFAAYCLAGPDPAIGPPQTSPVCNSFTISDTTLVY